MLPLKLRISHSDLDGLGAILVDYYAGIHFNTKFIIINYDDIRDEMGNFILPQRFPEIFSMDWESITITDISMPIHEFIANLKNKEVLINWFDHHPPSVEAMQDETVPKNVLMKHSTDSCGTKLYFDWLFAGRRTTAVFREFVELVNTYDLWKQDSALWEMAEDLNRFLSTQIDYKNKQASNFQKSAKFLDWMAKKFQILKDKNFSFSEFEKDKILGVRIREHKYLKDAREEIGEKIYTDSKGYKWAVFSSPAKISFVANKLLRSLPRDYVIGINTFKRELGRISVRSKKGFDVNWLLDVAGHECAGGGCLLPDRLDGVWKQGKELGYKNL